MATVAPMPIASIATAMAVKAGCFRSDRTAYPMSWRKALMMDPFGVDTSGWGDRLHAYAKTMLAT